MQQGNQILRYELWDQLKIIFDRYVNDKNQVPTSRVEQIVRNVLGQTTPQQISYVIKNMFRLDTNGSGTINYLQFGNFLFKRHCGQIALQVMHKRNLIEKGSLRKINLHEFFTLVNNAYAFLQVKMDMTLAQTVFKQADKDQDGYITYVEYFQYIEKCICQTKAQFQEYQKIPEKVKEREWSGKVRKYVWTEFGKIYQNFTEGNNCVINQSNLRTLINAILGQINQNEMSYILNNFSKLQHQTIQYISFTRIFIPLITELGLTRYQKNHDPPKETISTKQFIMLIRKTFKFVSIRKIKKNIFLRIFAKIDTNNDGLISINSYLDWIKRYLSVEINRGEEYYLTQDDANIEGYDIIQKQIPMPQLPTIKQLPPLTSLKFASYALSDEVHTKFNQLLRQHNKNNTDKLNQNQITQTLTNLLQLNQQQLNYSIRNIYQYNKNGEKYVTHEQFYLFCVQQYFGEIIVQKLHQNNTYSQGKDRMMNFTQFQLTLKRALSSIGMNATSEQISQLFKQIDVNNNEYISFQIYNLFLIYYFGSLRGKPYPLPNSPDTSSEQEWLESLSSLSPLDRVIRILFDQLVQIFPKYDFNKNMLFQENQIQALLHHVFELTDSEVSHVLLKLFNQTEQSKRNKSLTFTQLSQHLLQIYFIDLIPNRKRNNMSSSQQTPAMITIQYLLDIFSSACFFLPVKPSQQDLTSIFKSLNTNNNESISFVQYEQFIKKYFGFTQLQQYHQHSNQQSNGQPENVSNQQWKFINQIWNQLKTDFDKYDSGNKGYLTEQQFKKLLTQIFHLNTEQQINYICWNYFRCHSHTDKKIQFNKFAPFIILHLAQIALQKLEKEQVKDKKILNQKQLFIVLSTAFTFLSTMLQSQIAVHSIYTRIGMGNDPSYGAYLDWINTTLLKLR